MRTVFLLISCLGAGAASAGVEDWPNWRGPDGNGVSTESNLPAHWSETENIAWRARLAGVGLSTPVAIGHRILATSQVGRGVVRDGNHPTLGGGDSGIEERSIPDSEAQSLTFAVEAFHADDGRRLWEHRVLARPAASDYPEVHRKTNLANPSPVTDGERVYAWFGTGQLSVLDMDGKLLWEKHLGSEYGRYDITWGHSSSPTLYEDSLILLCDHEPASYLLALDKRTGEEKWRADRGKGLRSYSTPTVVSGPSGDELVVNSSERIEGYDPKTGERLWYLVEPNRFPIPVPSFADGIIYTSRGYRSGPYMALRPRRPWRHRRHRARRLARADRGPLRFLRGALRRCRLSRERRGRLTGGGRGERQAFVPNPYRGYFLGRSGGRRRQDLLRQRDRRDHRPARLHRA